jgi:hypothetical protein
MPRGLGKLESIRAAEANLTRLRQAADKSEGPNALPGE